MTNNLIYGIHSIRHALDKDSTNILELFVVPEQKNPRVLEVVAIAKQKKITIKSISKVEMAKLCETDKNQGLAAKLKELNNSLTEQDLLKHIQNNTKNLILILDGVQDPHNLGAILRTADAAGVTAVVVPQDNSVKITASVRKVASGAAENIPLVVVKNLARFMRELQELGVWTVGAIAKQSTSIYELDLTGNIALVLGAEGQGLRQLTAKHCDYLVSVPMYGVVESLNVSVTAGVLLFEVIRQRNFI